MGPRHRGYAGQGIPDRKGNTGLRRSPHPGQGCPARTVASRYRPHRRAGPAENRLPGANSFADTAKVLKATRASCAWSALGHAVAGYDAALNYATQRTQFGKPLARFQIVQEKLVRMLTEITAMQLYCQRIGQLDDTQEHVRHDRGARQAEQHRQGS